MACPTCDHTMHNLGHFRFWCPRCGTLGTKGELTLEMKYEAPTRQEVPNNPDHRRELAERFATICLENTIITHAMSVIQQNGGGEYWRLIGCIIALDKVLKDHEKTLYSNPQRVPPLLNEKE